MYIITGHLIIMLNYDAYLINFYHSIITYDRIKDSTIFIGGFKLSELQTEIQKRRTFAIISHPDAGKTTLTEKLLLYGGAIHLAGSIKSRKTQRHAVSDWMEIEKQRGISVTSSVLQFDYAGCRINILDTPGHQDFSEDTYRTLMAVDSAVMIIDVAKGVEAQTKNYSKFVNNVIFQFLHLLINLTVLVKLHLN